MPQVVPGVLISVPKLKLIPSSPQDLPVQSAAKALPGTVGLLHLYTLFRPSEGPLGRSPTTIHK